MSQKINSRCALCRRAGEKLLIKGEKCQSPKCPFIKRSYPPGQHGADARRIKLSGYGAQLKEKQKAKRIYGLIERQFSNYVAEASERTGDTSKFLLNYLESRLDNVVYRMGLAKARTTARQIVRHGHISVNGKKVDIPSYRVRVGDVVAVETLSGAKKGFEKSEEQLAKIEAPMWLGVDAKTRSAKVLNAPQTQNPGFDAKAVIEFYSR